MANTAQKDLKDAVRELQAAAEGSEEYARTAYKRLKDHRANIRAFRDPVDMMANTARRLRNSFEQGWRSGGSRRQQHSLAETEDREGLREELRNSTGAAA